MWFHYSGALTEENLLFLEAWRTIDRAYIDKTFNGQSWFRYRENALRNEPMNTREETCMKFHLSVSYHAWETEYFHNDHLKSRTNTSNTPGSYICSNIGNSDVYIHIQDAFFFFFWEHYLWSSWFVYDALELFLCSNMNLSLWLLCHSERASVYHLHGLIMQ